MDFRDGRVFSEGGGPPPAPRRSGSGDVCCSSPADTRCARLPIPRGPQRPPGPAAPSHHQRRPTSAGAASVPHIAVPVPDHPQEVKAEGQQGRPQQVPQGRQVGDGKAVGVFAAPPHGVDHPVRDAEQQQHLGGGDRQSGQEDRWTTPGVPTGATGLTLG